MDIEAATIIGVGAIIVGLALYIPCHFLAKYLLRHSAPKSNARSHITAFGAFFYGAMVSVLLAGYAQEHLFPDTWFGHFVSDWAGRLAYAGVVVAVSRAIAQALKKRGYVIWLPASVVQQASPPYVASQLKRDAGFLMSETLLQCDCCDHFTLTDGEWEICPVCFWEQDASGIAEPDEESGANHGLTLRQGRANFLTFGACAEHLIQTVVGPTERQRYRHVPRAVESPP